MKSSWLKQVFVILLLGSSGFALLDFSHISATGRLQFFPPASADALLHPLFRSVPMAHYSRSELKRLAARYDRHGIRQLLGEPDSVYRHPDGRQIWFYPHLTRNDRTGRTDQVTALKFATDGRVQKILF